MEEEYDVVVVGAGPAGSTSARIAAEGGLKVLLIARNIEIGVPDKCGEFLPTLEEMRRLAPDAADLEQLFDPPGWCILNRTRYVRFNFNGMREITVPFRGVVVDRKLYDNHLAREAAREGVEISLLTSAIDLLPTGGVLARRVGERLEIRSRLVIGADGAYSLIARRAGLPVSRDPLDYSVGYQYEMVDIEVDRDYVEMYFDRRYAPGAYAWIIPKGEDVANVGTGIRPPYMEKGLNIRDYLQNFLSHSPASMRLIRGEATAVKAGCIPVGGPMDRTALGKVLVVGDAAGHTLPTVGGGVPPALICGRIAGASAAEHLNEGGTLYSYEANWRKQIGRVLENSLRLRRMADLLLGSDEAMSLAARRGWIGEEMLMRLILCRMDYKMSIVEKALQIYKKFR
ncbi:NAD(P)/FAD-dependent oxidoreductase [Candidatus Bathyarchaeota archaeon]|nr:NAD(P)/FAD-dependent oxidoreductase [Candidatus Bathyarchaeota archaeon]